MKPKYRRRYRTITRRRNEEGSALSEMAPGIFLLVFFGLFLVVDVIALGYNYCSVVNLNDLQIREASKLPKSAAKDPKGTVKKLIPDKWKSTAIGAISSVPSEPVTTIGYYPGPGGVYVKVTTAATISPMITIPVMPGVPGLGAPATLTVTSQKLLENSRSVAQ